MCRKKCKTVASRINRFKLRVNEDPAFSSCFPPLYMMLLIHSGGNLCSRKCSLFCLKADAEPGWKSVLTERKQKTTTKTTLKLWKWLHRSGGWQAAFWKWAAFVYTQNISSTWESGDGAYLCARCGRENTVHVFKSVSQVDVSLTDVAALWGLLARSKVAQWQVESGEMACVFVMLNWAKESNWVGVRDWQCRLCLRARCGHFAGPIVHPPQ